MKTPHLLALLTLASALAAPAWADYPSRRITLMVPAAPGGGLDGLARFLAKRMQDVWGQAVVVENQGAADGLIATRQVAQGPADGHTLLLQIPSLLLLKHQSQETGFDPVGAFVPISEMGRVPSAIAVNAKLGVTSVKELVAHCNTAPKPCSWGYGQHLSYLYGKRALAISGIKETVSVPYKGTGPVVNDLLGGHITIAMTSIAAPLKFHQQGALRILAVNGQGRSFQAPEVPTFREAGLAVPARASWYGLFAPRQTPAAVLAKVEKFITGLAQDPAAQEVLRGLGAEPVFGSSRDFAAGLKEEEAFLDDLVKQYSLK